MEISELKSYHLNFEVFDGAGLPINPSSVEFSKPTKKKKQHTSYFLKTSIVNLICPHLENLSRGLARGREGDEWKRRIILQDFWRELSLVAAKAVSYCLLGQRQAAKQRATAKHECERRDVAMRAK